MTENTVDITEKLGVFVATDKLLKQTLDKRYTTFLNNPDNDYIVTGFAEIDNIIKGFRKGELTTIAVRPGIGKTAFLLSLINNIAVTHNKVVGVFSAERSARKLFTRMIESSTGLSLNKINSNRLTDVQKNVVAPVVKNLSYAKIYIDDRSNPTAEEIIEKAKVMADGGVEIIFIDYLELLTSGFKTKDKACNKDPLCPIIHKISELTKEINIPVVLFSQLSKPIVYNNRFKYTPDYVNEITDVLMFLNRPDFYHINDIDEKEKGIAEVTIAKHQETTEFKVAKLKFVESLDKYIDIV
jgi:replicative DNA helicase